MSDEAQNTDNAQPESAEETKRELVENQVDHVQLKTKLGASIDEITTIFGQTVIRTTRDRVLDALRILKTDPELNYAMMCDITAVDNMRRPDFEPSRRFTMIYIVYSVANKKRVRIEVNLPETDPTVPSTHGIYKGGGWIEREVYDMFGVIFENHPNLKRVLTPDYFEHHPLRKDYPLTGKGERDNFIRVEELE